MKLSVLIELVRGIKLDDNSSLVSGVSDRLTEDGPLATLFDQAQIEFCRRTKWLALNGAVATAQITLATGTQGYAYSPYILQVRGVRFSDSFFDLIHADESVIHSQVSSQDPLAFLDGSSPAPYTASAGRPTAYSLDAATRTITFDRAPSATENGLVANLRVWRLPLTELSIDDENSEPSIPAEYHYGLTDYVAKELLLSPNLDADVRAMGKTFEARWDIFLERARKERVEQTSETPVFRFRRW